MPDHAERTVATDEEARALASTLRLRILRVCLGEARSNKEIAEALGKDPATVLHHVRRLADTGFLEAQPPRRGTRGSREIPYLATGKSWHVQTPAQDRVLVDAFLEEVALVPVDEVAMTRMGFWLTDAEHEELLTRLHGLIDEFRLRAADRRADTRAYSAFLAVHPDPNRTREDDRHR